MRRQSAWYIGVWCIGWVILCGCGNNYQYIPKDIDPIAVDMVRFDSAQLSFVADSTEQGIKKLYDDYAIFMPLYVEGVLGIPSQDTAYLINMYRQFLMDTTMGFAQTNALAQTTFASTERLQEDINTAFSRLHYLFPEWEIPTVYLFVSGFNSSIFYYDNMIGVGVDMYLGSDYPYYNQVVYDYQKQTMRPACIAVDMMSMYLAYHIAYNGRTNRLLDQMIFRGKQMFILSQLLPDYPAWEIMGYSKEQWEWCEYYEQAIWKRIMEKKDLFKTESSILTSYLNDGPFTAEVTQESPGRLGIWVGWQIVESFMKHNPDVDIHELIAESDAQKILEKSFYKP